MRCLESSWDCCSSGRQLHQCRIVGQPSGKKGGHQAPRPAAAQSNGNNSDNKAIIAPLIQRRAVLGGLSVGAAYAYAGRSLRSAAADEENGGYEDVMRTLEERVSEFALPNGLRFLVLERHAVPVVSCTTYAAVGAFDERDGQTGIAHLLEHLAFKGTRRVGTSDWKREAPLLDALDEVFYEQREAQRSGDADRAAALVAKLDLLQTEAAQLSVPNEFGALLQRAGAVGLNASTSHDATRYYASLPANKLELWFALEAERFQDPVFREVYSEKRVVLEERRLRVEAAPLGAFQEQFALAAHANNYRRPVIGFQEDIEALGRRDVSAFFKQYYGPERLTIAVVGDATPSQVHRLAERYFGRWSPPAVPQPQQVAAALPLSTVPAASAGLQLPGIASSSAGGGTSGRGRGELEVGERELRGRSSAGPLLLSAYRRPSVESLAESVALDVISGLLNGGRASLYNRNLLQKEKALAADAVAAYPADLHPCLFLTVGVPPPGRSLKQLQADMAGEVARLADGTVKEQDLQRIKKANRVQLLEAVRSNSAMASVLASYSAQRGGGWRMLGQELAAAEGVEPGAVRDVTARILAPQNEFTGYVEKA